MRHWRMVVAALGVSSLASAGAWAQTYQATVISPASASESFIFGAGGAQAVGTSRGPFSLDNTHAFLWPSVGGTPISLNPIGTFSVPTNAEPVPASGSFAYGAGGGQQVGQTILGLTDAATLWSGSAASAVFLNPPGVDRAIALATDGARQVGSCRVPPDTRAYAWAGSAESAVSLHPSSPSLTYTSSIANSISNGRAAGLAYDDNDVGFYNAVLWTALDDASVVVLHDASLLESRANAVVAPAGANGTVQIFGESYPDGLPWQATKWEYTPGSAVSRVSLHPSGYFSSFIRAANATRQVGIATLPPNSDGVAFEHAFTWASSAASGVDLHAALLQVAPGYENSVATGIDSAGNIYGYAYTVDPASGLPLLPYAAVRWSQVAALGACCSGSTCVSLAASACTGPNTSFAGVGTTCGVSNVTPCCKADYNHAGGLSVQDVFDFLSGWFSGAAAADFNGSGGTTTQDIFDFLAAWFAGC